MGVVKRNILESYFRKGSLPTQEQFQTLIESLVHQDELQVQLDEKSDETAFQELYASYRHHLEQYHRLAGGISFEAVWTVSVPADGIWYSILDRIEGSYTFEVIAAASGAADASDHAMTHAVAVISGAALPGSIQQTAAYGGWWRSRRVLLEWQKEVEKGGGFMGWVRRLFSRRGPYNLCIRTGRAYRDPDGNTPFLIKVRIIQRWGNPLRDEQKVPRRILANGQKEALTGGTSTRLPDAQPAYDGPPALPEAMPARSS